MRIRKGIFSLTIAIPIFSIALIISGLVYNSQTGNIDKLLKDFCATDYAQYVPFCGSEPLSLADSTSQDSMAALACAVNAASSEKMDTETCPNAKQVTGDIRCYGKTCVRCTQFGGIEEVMLPADPGRAKDIIGGVIVDCFRFARSGQGVYCAKLDTSQMGRAEVTKNAVFEWLRENGGTAGKDIAGSDGAINLAYYDIDTIKMGFSGSNKVAIYTDNTLLNQIWIADAEPARPENVPEDIWDMRSMARQVKIGFKSRGEAIENIAFEVLECFEQHVKDDPQDYYCAEIDTSVWDESVAVTEDDIDEWLRVNGGPNGKDLIGDGLLNRDDLGWRAGTLRKNSPALISVFSIAGPLKNDAVYVYKTYGHEIPASEEPRTTCNLTDFDLPQGDDEIKDWILQWGDPKYLAYWQTFPVEEDTWSYKPGWATYAVLGAISVIQPFKIGRILVVTSGRTLLAKLIPKLGAYWARNAIKNTVTQKVLEKAITATLKKQTKSGVIKSSRVQIADLVNAHLKEAIDQVDKEMAERFATASAAEAQKLAEDYSEAVAITAFQKAALSTKDANVINSMRKLTGETNTALAPIISKRTNLLVAREMGISGMKEQLKNHVYERFKANGITSFETLALRSKAVATVAKRMGIYTTAAWALAIADSMTQARFEPVNDKLALKPAVKKLVTYDLKKHWPVLVYMPNSEDHVLLPEIFGVYKPFHLASPCHLSTLDATRVIAQCGEYTFNVANKTASCTGKITVEKDFGKYSCSMGYLNPATENPYVGSRGPMKAMANHADFILSMKEIPDALRYIYDEGKAVFPLYFDSEGLSIIYHFNPRGDGGSDTISVSAKESDALEITLQHSQKKMLTDSGSLTYPSWSEGSQEYGIETTVTPEFDTDYHYGLPGSTPTKMFSTFDYDGKRFVRYGIAFRFNRANCISDEKTCSRLSLIDGIKAGFGAEREDASIEKTGGEWGDLSETATETSLKLTTSGTEGSGGIAYMDDDLDGDVDNIQITSGDKSVTLSDNYDEGEIDSFQMKNCRTYAISIEGMVKADDGEENYCTRGKGTGTAWLEWGGDAASMLGTVGLIASGFVTGGGAWAIALAKVAAVTALAEVATQAYAEEKMGKWPKSW